MAFLWFKRNKGKREEDRAVKKDKAIVSNRVFRHELLEAAFYHSNQFSTLRSVNTEATRSCAYAEGLLTIQCYLQYLCWKSNGSIKGTRDIPAIAKQANLKETVVDQYTYKQLLALGETTATVYANLGIAKVTLAGIDQIADVIAKLEIICKA